MAKTTSIWTPEKVIQLHAYVRDDLTGGQIASLMGTTRSAVISRATRDGLRLGANRVKVVKARPKQVRPPVMRPIAEAVMATQQPRKDVVKGAYTIMDLDSYTCRWPIGDHAPFTFCGDMPVHGPYCKKHAILAFNGHYVRRDARPYVSYSKGYSK